ncbi:MAG: efflux RND transporter periplasmic adaptor subunit [bacterium]
MKRWIVTIVVLAVVTAIATGGWWMWKKRKTSNGYRTVKIEQGDIVQIVRATGTIQPITLIQVGTQVNGPVRKLFVDYNDRVKEGDLVAQIDPTVYEARLAQDQASLLQSEASVDQAQARLDQAEKDLVRSKELAKRDMLSLSELDATVANRDTLVAQLKVARAAVEQSKATLRLSKANLDYTTIRSPINGVIIARNVDEGQTVVASMSAQLLFSIAADLQDIQVEASIPESEIGKISVGQPVSFTVDAYDKSFTGTVSTIRLAAATVQNVVTYPVIVKARNPDSKLFPGMTANISCEVARSENVLKLPNAALRYRPVDEPKAQQSADKKKSKSKSRQASPRVWIQKQGSARPTPVEIQIGISDGLFTELKSSLELKEGDEVIVGSAVNDAAATKAVNPFTPTMPGGRRN